MESNGNDVLDLLARVLIRCFLMGLVLLVVWFGLILLAGDFVYRLHGGIFEIPRSQFDSMHYAGMMFCKIALFTLFLIPWIAIRMVRGKSGR